eukprot:7033154-Pyramimonas_sp.AAC.1
MADSPFLELLDPEAKPSMPKFGDDSTHVAMLRRHLAALKTETGQRPPQQADKQAVVEKAVHSKFGNDQPHVAKLRERLDAMKSDLDVPYVRDEEEVFRRGVENRIKALTLHEVPVDAFEVELRPLRPPEFTPETPCVHP